MQSNFRTGLITFSTGLITEEPVNTLGEQPTDLVGSGIVPSTNIHDISVRDFSGPVLDQGHMNTCMENALVTAIDLQMRESGHPLPALSRLQSYYDTREAQGTVSSDSGSIMEVTLNQGISRGIALESLWQYSQSNLYTQPSQAVYADAAQHRILSFDRLATETQYSIIENGVKKALSEGKPVILGFNVDPWFFSQVGPLQSQTGTGPDTTGSGHAVVIVAVDENGTPNDVTDDSAIIKNSWNTVWGDGGYGKVRFSEFTGGTGDMVGMYTISGFAGQDWTFSQQRIDVAELYVALLNRAPDHSGQDWWASTLVGGRTDVNLANDLLSCSEEQVLYGNASHAEFLTAIYHNALGRDPDAEGLNWWVSVLNSGMSRGAVADQILEDTRGYVNGSNQQYDQICRHSRDFLNNKVDAAMHFGVTYQSNNLDVATVALVGINDNYSSVLVAENNVAHLLGYL